MSRLARFGAVALLALPPAVAAPAPLEAHSRVQALRILVLSTMLADEGIGEWGFAALVEADGRKILFDTGARPQTVLQNARELKVDLAGVREVVLSHHHDDHTGGLLTLRRELAAANPGALARIHVGRGIFLSRPSPDGGEGNSMIALRAAFEATSGTFIEHDAPVALLPGVWLTGPVPRVHPERNFGPPRGVRGPEGVVEDTIPEDEAERSRPLAGSGFQPAQLPHGHIVRVDRHAFPGHERDGGEAGGRSRDGRQRPGLRLPVLAQGLQEADDRQALHREGREAEHPEERHLEEPQILEEGHLSQSSPQTSPARRVWSRGPACLRPRLHR